MAVGSGGTVAVGAEVAVGGRVSRSLAALLVSCSPVVRAVVSSSGVGVGEGEGVSVGVGGGVDVGVARLNGVTDASAKTIGVGVMVVNLATRMVGSGVEVTGTEENWLKRQATARPVDNKKQAILLKFFLFTFSDPNKTNLIIRSGLVFLDS